MVQRIQSIFLFVAAVLMLVSAFFFTIWEAEVDSCTYVVSSIKQTAICGETTKNSMFTGYVLILEVVFSVICFYSIFSFKNRKRQLILGGINSVLGSLCLVCIILFTKDLVDQYKGDYQLGFYFPIVAIFLNVMANRFIRKDERLVKSLDRIR